MSIAMRQVHLEAVLRFGICGAMMRRGLPKLAFAGDVYARLCSMCNKKLAASVFAVIQALLQWASPDHNRVWISKPKLAETAGVAKSTVEIALQLLIDAGAIRHITDHEELHTGDPCEVNDGPHRRAAQLAAAPGTGGTAAQPDRAYKPVNTYDICGMFYCLPMVRRIELLEAALKSGKVVDYKVALLAERSSFHSFEKMGMSPGKNPAHAETNLLRSSDTRSGPDPATRDVVAGKSPPGNQSVSVSSIGLGIGAEEEATNGSGETTHPPKTTVAPSAGGNLTPINRAISGKGTRNKPPQNTREASGWRMGIIERIAVEALKIIGLRSNARDGNVPVEIVRTMGVKWASELVEYWHWWHRQGFKRINQGYLVKIWRDWSSEPGHSWDQDFANEMRHVGRAWCSSLIEAEARCSGGRINWKRGIELMSTQHAEGTQNALPLDAPPSEPTTPPERVRIPPDWLPGLDYETARKLCGRAVHLLRLVDQQTRLLSPEVRDHARSLWQQDNPGKVAPWEQRQRIGGENGN